MPALAANPLQDLVDGRNLSQSEAYSLIGDIVDGGRTSVQSAALLVALRAKGECMAEIIGAARAMRERSLRVEHDLDSVVDVVGTGGDGMNTINLSTMAALVAAASGVPVAKHGNRAASSVCGSADVLEAAGLPLEIAPERASKMLSQAGFTFLFAPVYHPAMRIVAPLRRELGLRTIFNILGPLANPAGATHMVVGVARESLLEIVGESLRALGARRGAVVYGTNGIDEVAGDVPTRIYSFDESGSRAWQLEPSEYGVNAPLAAIQGNSVGACRDAFFAILAGERSARGDVVALNAALVLYTVGLERRFADAFERSRAVLASGAALAVFERARAMALG